MVDEIRESYRSLELEEDASPEAVKDAYRALVKVWHPDRFGDDEKLRRRADEKLKQINQAYELLKNRRPSSRRRSEPRATRPAQSGDTEPRRPEKPRVAPMPHAKIERAPNMLHARLGCLLVGGVSSALLVLILASFFYDDSLSGRRTVALKPPKPAAREVQAEEQAEEQADAEGSTGASPGGATEALEELRFEANLAELEVQARQAAIEAAVRLPGGGAPDPQARVSGRVPTKAGDRSFLSEQFFKNGTAHLNSQAGPREDAKAVDWFRRAAQRGHVASQKTLAALLREGRGGEADMGRALFWMLVAAGQGDAEAKRLVAKFEEGVEVSQREASRRLAAAELRRLQN